jgi:hypothetical protein
MNHSQALLNPLFVQMILAWICYCCPPYDPDDELEVEFEPADAFSDVISAALMPYDWPTGCMAELA